MTSRTRWIVAGLWLFCFGGTVFGQEAPVKPDEKSASKKEPAPSTIYLPFKNLRTAFEKDGAAVFVPYGEYLRLWDLAVGKPKKPDQPPVGGLLTKAAYVATVQKDLATVTAKFDVQVLDAEWAEIPIRFGDAAIAKISSDSGKVLLRGVAAGEYSLLVSASGNHKVELELSARVKSAPDGKSIELTVPPVGISTFEIVVPEADQTIELKPLLVVQGASDKNSSGTEKTEAGSEKPNEGKAKETRVTANIGSTDKISARWHSRVGTKPDMELLASVTNQTAVSVDDGLIHHDAWLTFEVLRGQQGQVRVAVPKKHRILDVTSDAKIREWKVAEEENRQVIAIELLNRATGKFTVEVHTEVAQPAEAFDAGGKDDATAYGIHALDVIRESGQLAMRAGSDLTLAIDQQQGVSRIDESEAGDRLKKPGSLYFRYYSPAFRLKGITKPVEPRILVNHSALIEFRDDQLRSTSHLQYTIERAGLFELKFKLPEKFTVENVVCDGLKQFDVSPEGQSLSVLLQKKFQGTLNLRVSGFRSQAPTAEPKPENNSPQVLLPIIEPVGVELENGKVVVYAPPSLEVLTDTSKVGTFQPDPNPNLQQVPNARFVSAWTFNRRPVEIPVTTLRKPTLLTAFHATRIDIKQGQVQVQIKLNYRIEYAGLETFQFAVPEAISDKVQIVSLGDGTVPQIKQKSRADKAKDGWVTWTVVLQREHVGVLPLQITYDLTPESDAVTKTERSIVKLLRVLDSDPPKSSAAAGKEPKPIPVSRVEGEVSLIKDRAIAVGSSGSGGDLEPIDVRELTVLPQDGFAAYRFYSPEAMQIELSASKYDIQQVVKTVISRGLVEAVIDRSGSVTYRARYQLKSSEKQRLRVDLPNDIELLGVQVDRKPVALEENNSASPPGGWKSYFLNVAREKSADEPFHVALAFRAKLSPLPFENRSGDLLLRLPGLGGDGKEAGQVATQQLKVAVWVPEDHALVGQPPKFTTETKRCLCELIFWKKRKPLDVSALDTWIGQESGGLFDFPREGVGHLYSSLGGQPEIYVRWWHLPFYTWIISGALLIIAWLLRKTACENKLTVILLAMFIAAAWSLSDFDAVIHTIGVASYGLAGLIALWLIHACCGIWSTCCKPAAVVLNTPTIASSAEPVSEPVTTSEANASPPPTADSPPPPGEAAS